MPDDATANNPMAFGQTSWTVVFQAARGGDPEATEAWQILAQRYRRPLHAFCMRQGDSYHDADDHVQGFFARLLEANRLKAARPGRGLFRNWLMAGIQQHRHEQHRRANAAKRRPEGGFVPLDIVDLGDRGLDAGIAQPHPMFMQEWALELVRQARDLLRRRYAARGREDRFDQLWPHLTPGLAGDHAALAQRLQMKPASLSDALSDFREEFRRALRQVVREGLDECGDVDAEIRELLGAFG